MIKLLYQQFPVVPGRRASAERRRLAREKCLPKAGFVRTFDFLMKQWICDGQIL